MTTHDDLAAAHAIGQTKAGYCRFIDTKQWHRLPGLFTPDATVAGLNSTPDGASAADFVEGVSRGLGPSVSIHHVHTPQIERTAPDRARVIWQMMDYVEFPEGAEPPGPFTGRGWMGWGFYEEEYARTDTGWLIAFMRLTRLRMDALTGDRPPIAPGRIAPDPDWI